LIYAIAHNEFRRLFLSPLAWTVLAVVQVILALLMLIFTNAYLTEVQPRYAGVEGAPGATDSIVSPLLLWAGIVMLVVSPLITMRLISEERQTGSLPLLISSPVTISEIVIGKYLGLMVFYALMVGMIALMPLTLAFGGGLDWGKLAAGLLGLLLLLGSFAAAGLYLSCLAPQPMVAALGSFGLLMLLALLTVADRWEGSGQGVLVYISHFGHFMKFLDGLFDSADFFYYLLFIGTFLILSIRRLDNLRLMR
jgi:ABC-2 type transport system permease protein